MRFTFVIPGKPFAKQRPRFGNGRTYTPKATISFEQTVRTCASQVITEPLEGPVKVEILATFEPAKSWSKKKTAEHLNKSHMQRPDLDNIEKAICDGLNRTAFADDGQIAEMHSRKVWGPRAQTVVTVEALPC
jgi:Holliday junction resolvase RusA-like endonuclease